MPTRLMLRVSLAFFAVAALAAMTGFSGVTSSAFLMGKVIFVVFEFVAVAGLVVDLIGTTRRRAVLRATALRPADGAAATA